MTADRIFIVGCGDIGRRVARLALAEGKTVGALVRSPDKETALAELGIAAVPGNLDEPESLACLPSAGTSLFYFAPPPGGGIFDTRVRNLCAAIPAGAEPGKIVYISTSGVYGDCGGEVVTEETPANPQTSRAKRRLDAEEVLQAFGRERNVPVVVLRVTGIYGPGRLPIRHIREGQPVLRAEEASYTNRIHADDLARVCLAAAERGEAGEIFNVSDGQAGTMTDYFNAVADAAGLPRPRQVTMEEAHRVMSPLMISYVTESRRMDNRKMREKLGITLLYPDLDTGLKASLE